MGLPALEQVALIKLRGRVVDACELLSATPWWSKVRAVHVAAEYREAAYFDDDGELRQPELPLEGDLAWLARPRPAQLVVGFEQAAPEKLPPGVRAYSAGRVETAFVVTQRFGAEERRAVANLARMSNAHGFAIQVAEAPGTGLSLCRVLGEGVSWGPRAVAEVLARRGAQRVSCFIISQSNTLVRAWSGAGPLEEHAWEWLPVARRVLEGLHGFDPGLALEQGVLALDLAPLELLVGSEARLELLTELSPAPVLPRDDNDEPITHDAMSLPGSSFDDLLDEDDGPLTVDEELADNEPHRDAADATASDVLAEGPVEWDDGWDADLFAPPEDVEDPDLQMVLASGEPVEDDEDEQLTVRVSAGSAALQVVRCDVCARVADVEACDGCGLNVCLACSAVEEDTRVCFECQQGS